MKYVKTIGLLAVAAAAMMMFAATVSATELTSPKGTKLGKGTIIKAENVGPVVLDGTITIQCEKASGEGEISEAGGSTTTVKGFVTFGKYEECGSHTVTVLDTGQGEMHSTGPNTATLTASEVEVTVLIHSIFLGTVHCIYASEDNIAFGTVTGSGHGSNTAASLDLDSDPIPQKETDAACGDDATITANGVATSPQHIYID